VFGYIGCGGINIPARSGANKSSFSKIFKISDKKIFIINILVAFYFAHPVHQFVV
jgi:hypothetical protein